LGSPLKARRYLSIAAGNFCLLGIFPISVLKTAIVI
jgi:hypothetical protein